MKRRNQNGAYVPIPRMVFTHEGFNQLSASAKLLLLYLFELEHRFTGDKVGYFFRSNEDLASDTGLSARTIQKAKEELKEHVSDLVKIGYMHWVFEGKKSKKKITSFTIKV